MGGSCGLRKLLVWIEISEIFHHVHIHNEKGGTLVGVVGADDVELEEVEWGEGQEDVKVLDKES